MACPACSSRRSRARGDTRVDGGLGDREHVARQDDLGQVPGADAFDGGGHRAHVPGRVDLAVGPADAGGRGGRADERQRLGVFADRGVPGDPVAAADDDARHDQDRFAGLGVEGEAAERDGAGAGDPQGVIDPGGGEHRSQPGAGTGEAVFAAGQDEAGGLAPADQALAVPDPGQRLGVGEARDQVFGRGGAGDGDGPYGQPFGDSHSDVHNAPLYGRFEPVQTAGALASGVT